MPLPKYVEALLKTCPPAGRGVHNWLFRTAKKLNKYFSDPEDLISALSKAVENCGRPMQADEIPNAVYNSREAEGNAPGRPSGLRWPKKAITRIHNAIRLGPTLEKLESLSPIQVSRDGIQTEDILKALFPGEALICAGPKLGLCATKTLSQWGGQISRQQFVVPSPMTAVVGKSLQGRCSARTNQNTGPRRFVVVEFDQGSHDEHAALLWHLAYHAPLSLVVHSGNKSLHGWFFCHGADEEQTLCFFEYAVSLGADRATWTKCQLVRMPGALRDTGALQRVIYFNPNTVKS